MGPPGQQPSGWSRAPAAPVISGWAPQSLPPRPHSPGPLPPALPANLGSAFRDDRLALTRGGPPLRRARPCHLPLRHHLQCLPRLTPPSRAAALGTIPAAHWLLPRQPGATPLPIGPAWALRHLCAGLSVARTLGQIPERGVGLTHGDTSATQRTQISPTKR